MGSMDATEYENNGSNGLEGNPGYDYGDNNNNNNNNTNGFASPLFASGAGGSLFGTSNSARRRLISSGASTSAYIKVSTNGNQGTVGKASESAASSPGFSGSISSSRSSADGVSTSLKTGMSSSATLGIAIGCTAIAALAVALVVHTKQQADARKNPMQANANRHTRNPLSKQDTVSRAIEESTDVL
jgi:hypothetical protein